MLKYLSNSLSASAYPALVTLCFILLIMFWRILSLPTPDELIKTIETLFILHGWWIVAASAFVEGIAVVNLYFPGSLVIIVGVTSSLGHPSVAAIMIVVTMIGFLLSSIINYLIGFYSFHTILLRLGGKIWFDKAQAWHQRYGSRALFVAYIHPNIGGLMALSCGSAHYSFYKYISPTVLGIVFWNTCWGILTYYLAPTLRKAASSIWPVVILLVVWTILTFTREFIHQIRTTK